MRSPRLHARAGSVAAALTAMAAATAMPAWADDVAARHGQRLYLHGVDRDGTEIAARVGPGARLPGPLAACAGCHGASGRGSRDAGLQAPPLRWSTLVQARPARDGLLARPAYDEAALLRALRDGIDAAGRPLAAAMPRFDLSPRAAADLLHHLRRIGTDADPQPGVDTDRVRLGTVLPRGAAASPAGQALLAGTRACLEKANRDGGVHGRRLELEVLDADPPDAAGVPDWTGRVLMLVAPWWPDGSATALSRRLGPVVVLGPLGAAAELDGASDGWFGIAPMPGDQARVAVDRVATLRPQARLLVVADASPAAQAAARAAADQAGRHADAGTVVDVLTLADPARDAAALAARLHAPAPAAAVLAVVAPDALAAVSAAIDAAAPPPDLRLLVPAGQAGSRPLGWPPSQRARVRLLSSAVAEDDFDPRAYHTDLAAIGASPTLPAVQTLGYAAGCATVEALRRAGRQLDRERVVQALASLHRFPTGVTPPIGFGPRQRHGAWQSRLLRVADDGRGFVPDGGWLAPKEAS